MRRCISATALGARLAGAARAGPACVDGSGFAVSGHDVVAHVGMNRAPVGERQPAAVPGGAAITAEHEGATYALASEENRDRFLEDPGAFAPRHHGHCAHGVARGVKVHGNTELRRIVDGLLDITETVVGFREEDTPGDPGPSDAGRNGLEAEPAPGRPIPQFDPAGAPLR